MYDTQASTAIGQLLAAGMPETQAQVLLDLLGNCSLPLQHAGDVTLNNLTIAPGGTLTISPDSNLILGDGSTIDVGGIPVPPVQIATVCNCGDTPTSAAISLGVSLSAGVASLSFAVDLVGCYGSQAISDNAITAAACSVNQSVTLAMTTRSNGSVWAWASVRVIGCGRLFNALYQGQISDGSGNCIGDHLLYLPRPTPGAIGALHLTLS